MIYYGNTDFTVSYRLTKDNLPTHIIITVQLCTTDNEMHIHHRNKTAVNPLDLIPLP